jgi:hypothetical protein
MPAKAADAATVTDASRCTEDHDAHEATHVQRIFVIERIFVSLVSFATIVIPSVASMRVHN